MTPTKIKLLQSLNFDFKQKRKHKKRKVEVTRNSETEKKWKEMFDAFIEYKKEHNDPDVKKTEETMALYNWMMCQRAEYKKLATTGESKLSAMKIQQLNDAGFKFAKRPRYTKWSDRIKQLKVWKEKNGHLKIPINDPELGEFASRQRTEYTRFLEGHTDIGLTKERVKQLTDMGFVFSSGKRYDPSRKGIKRKTWEERFNQFLEFKQKHGHGFVTQQGDTDGLGEWVKSQRKYYKKLKANKPCPLTAEKAMKLQEAGFVFDALTHRKTKVFSLDDEVGVDLEGDQKMEVPL
jgi:hypothetical protein